MNILLSNDDGYLADGIKVMFAELQNHPKVADVMLIAPDRNRSAASNSLTLMNPLRLHQHDERTFSVTGTPTDCVHLGANGALDFEPDLVISGINEGANMGDDVIYSGTVAAATEGRHLGKPAIAISLVGDQHYASAAKVVSQLLDELFSHNLDNKTILNINVPDLPFEQIKGIKVTRLGSRHPSGKAVQELDPRGKPMFWIGPAGLANESGLGTDFEAVEAGYASVTPLQIDLTHHALLRQMAKWVDREWPQD